MHSTRNLLLLIALGGMAFALPAVAQQSTDYPAPCDASKVTRADVDRAHSVFLSGKQFLEESNYDKAISYFKDAYSIDCSVHAMLPIIATAYERKGDKTEAVRALEEYLRRVANAPDHEVVERRIRNLRDQVAREQATAAAPAPAPSAAAPSPAPSASAEAPAPSSAPASIAMSDAGPPRTGGRSVIPWVLVGVGGAAAAAGLLFYLVGAGDIASAEKLCLVGGRAKCASPSGVDQGNRGRNEENLGGVVMGGGLAVVGAGLLWHFLEKPADARGGAPMAVTRVRPVVSPGYAGVAFDTVFE
jgi:tetratricopeptide (TPR) repeat protein